jgi:hypothetical protein
MQLQTASMSYASSSKLAVKKTSLPSAPESKTTGQPDFAKMSPEERLAFHRKRLNKMFGE